MGPPTKNPRKFRDKIALQKQLQDAKDQEFHAIMQEVSGVKLERKEGAAGEGGHAAACCQELSARHACCQEKSRHACCQAASPRERSPAMLCAGPIRHKSGDPRSSPYDRSRSVSPANFRFENAADASGQNGLVILTPRPDMSPGPAVKNQLEIPGVSWSRQRSDPNIFQSLNTPAANPVTVNTSGSHNDSGSLGTAFNDGCCDPNSSSGSYKARPTLLRHRETVVSRPTVVVAPERRKTTSSVIRTVPPFYSEPTHRKFSEGNRPRIVVTDFECDGETSSAGGTEFDFLDYRNDRADSPHIDQTLSRTPTNRSPTPDYRSPTPTYAPLSGLESDSAKLGLEEQFKEFGILEGAVGQFSPCPHTTTSFPCHTCSYPGPPCQHSTTSYPCNTCAQQGTHNQLDAQNILPRGSTSTYTNSSSASFSTCSDSPGSQPFPHLPSPPHNPSPPQRTDDSLGQNVDTWHQGGGSQPPTPPEFPRYNPGHLSQPDDSPHNPAHLYAPSYSSSVPNSPDSNSQFSNPDSPSSYPHYSPQMAGAYNDTYNQYLEPTAAFPYIEQAQYPGQYPPPVMVDDASVSPLHIQEETVGNNGQYAHFSSTTSQSSFHCPDQSLDDLDEILKKELLNL